MPAPARTINLTIVVRYIINFWLRSMTSNNPDGYVRLSLLTILMLVVSGGLGGRTVYVLGVGTMPTPELRRP